MINDVFVHNNSFSGIIKRIKEFSGSRGPNSPKELLQQQAKEVARRILLNEYDVRGFQQSLTDSNKKIKNSPIKKTQSSKLKLQKRSHEFREQQSVYTAYCRRD